MDFKVKDGQRINAKQINRLASTTKHNVSVGQGFLKNTSSQNTTIASAQGANFRETNPGREPYINKNSIRYVGVDAVHETPGGLTYAYGYFQPAPYADTPPSPVGNLVPVKVSSTCEAGDVIMVIQMHTGLVTGSTTDAEDSYPAGTSILWTEFSGGGGGMSIEVVSTFPPIPDQPTIIWGANSDQMWQCGPDETKWYPMAKYTTYTGVVGSTA